MALDTHKIHSATYVFFKCFFLNGFWLKNYCIKTTTAEPLMNPWAFPERNTSGWRSKTKQDISGFCQFCYGDTLLFPWVFPTGMFALSIQNWIGSRKGPYAPERALCSRKGPYAPERALCSGKGLMLLRKGPYAPERALCSGKGLMLRKGPYRGKGLMLRKGPYAPERALCSSGKGLILRKRPYAPERALCSGKGLMLQKRPYAPERALCSGKGLMLAERALCSQEDSLIME